MSPICDLCGRLFEDNDKIKAVVIGRFASLKSKRIYALKTPLEECRELIHFHCNYPQGNIPEKDNV